MFFRYELTSNFPDGKASSLVAIDHRKEASRATDLQSKKTVDEFQDRVGEPRVGYRWAIAKRSELL